LEYVLPSTSISKVDFFKGRQRHKEMYAR
jgi:hypothetical protein